MSKFRAMALKVDDGTASPLASTSSITLEDHPSRSPSKVNVESDVVKVEGHSVIMNDTRPFPDPSSDVKMEDEGKVLQKMKPSPSPKFEDRIPTKSEPSTSTSASASPKPESTPPALTRPLKKGPQLIGNLPIAIEEAMKTFVEIQENYYQYSTLGRSREALESMTCECPPDGSKEICVEDCINRLTQVECLPGDCKGGAFCMNQRFQRREYANIEIVKTEKKGFGLRAAEDMPKDAFIYEYVGDVVSNPSFIKRMREYAEEGIKHFYFMMLQKDEFIDATKRGGIGRFANHSCNPNCYVAKWTIGQHVRMGIFSNRTIKKDEELTFNYNVDRYGAGSHDAQPCYCGEDKCVGFIGGKTQTDLAGMDDLYLDALGITDEPILKPLALKEVPKVIQAMRQTQSRKVLVKLLTRIKTSEDQSALRQMMRLRGFSLMTNIMDDYEKDLEILMLTIDCMNTWPLISRNKVEDSKVSVPVQRCAESENAVLKKAAEDLLDKWSTLETAYRIPKRLKGDDGAEDPGDDWALPPSPRPEDRLLKRSKLNDLVEAEFVIKPAGFTHARQGNPRILDPQEQGLLRLLEMDQARLARLERTKAETAAIIAAAAAAQKAAEERALEEAAAAAEQQSKEEERMVERERRQKERKERDERRQGREDNREKRLLKLVGAVVVKTMSKYRTRMDVDMFKKHAKELTHVIVEKEKKSSSYRDKDNKLETLSEEKATKIKKFAREYINKVLHRLEKGKGQRRPPESSSSTTTTTRLVTDPSAPPPPLSSSSSSRSHVAGILKDTSSGGDSGGDGPTEVDMDMDMDMDMSAEEAMDLSADEDNGDEDGDDHEDGRGRDENGIDDEDGSQPTPVEPAESDTSTAVAAPAATLTDPRLRARAAHPHPSSPLPKTNYRCRCRWILRQRRGRKVGNWN
ncbi:hypothetical protein B0F90DRAFT_1818675 [Multifurca ochricompacta]|uniref:Histone-lysine N-methyltransferase, H3 lysine-36 specific n=1 Tax=Multifurca ochricompacta TaxID=376703 RepID=A0AAD4QL56_9AGAM|nr:hypothetical protein B0F90DRAFT_1818675 [Multifurca ochricompacta]